MARQITSYTLKNNQDTRLNQEIQRLWGHYRTRGNESEEGYKAWFSSAENTIKSINSQQCFKKLRASKQKVRLETRIMAGIAALDYALDFLEKPENIKKVALIKAGEPLKGRDMLKEFLQGAKKFVKIQEPYPDTELLRLLEVLPSSVKVQLLLGPIRKKKDFEHELKLLRKTGKTIESVSLQAGNSAPFHDRFVIHEGKAISVGTSLSGIGLRDSTINELSEWSDIEQRFDEYFNADEVLHRGTGCLKKQV